MPPFVATLATLTAASGLAYAVGGGAPITGLPTDYGRIANTVVLGLRIPVWVAIIGFVVLAVVMRRTTYGSRIYAVGGNPTAAQIAGINVRLVLFSAYAISGVLAGLSGILGLLTWMWVRERVVWRRAVVGGRWVRRTGVS